MKTLRVLKRRQFLRNTAGMALACAGFPTIVPASVFGADSAVAPSNRITVACIGTGPQGLGVMGGFLDQKNARVVAICDVKREQREQACAVVNETYKNQDCKAYIDFREVLNRNDIDACLIATPDHWHVPIAVAAIRAGKGIYLEKPIGCSVAEAQILRKAVREHGRIFQFGTQQRSDRKFRTACEMARSGVLGKLKAVHVWAPGSTPGGSTKVVPVPPTLEYDRWLGPAPFRPYTENRCDADGATKTWWFDSDYAAGFIAGWGIHPMDIATWGAGDLMKGVVEVEGTGNYPTEGACNTATTWDVRMKFSSGLRLIFAGSPNGGNSSKPTGEIWPHEKEWRGKFGEITTHGTVFEGTDGWVRVQRGDLVASSEDLLQAERKVTLKNSGHHVRNFLESIASRQPAISHIEDSFTGDTLCQISDIAARLQRKLRFDFAAERFINDDEANKRLALRDMRGPWKLE
ncbi:MAG: Gfo/Idh/MocA family protein [Limisphaerales bacterium]